MRHRWRKLRTRADQPPPDDFALPIRPVVIAPAIPKGVPHANAALTAIHYGDVHFPFEDAKALRVLYAVIADLQPQLVVCHGDLLDCYQISRYEKNPSHRVSLQREIEAAAEHLGIIASLAPQSQRKLIKGNHEDRLRKVIWKMATDVPAREVLQIPQVAAALDWPSLLGLDSSGWEWLETRETLFKRIVLKHGSVVRKWSGQTEKAEWEKYGKSGISGHSHRLGAFFHRDWNAQHGWWGTGCMCDLNPEYVEDPDWQTGFLVVTWNADRTQYAVEQVHVHNGTAIFRGKVYSA